MVSIRPFIGLFLLLLCFSANSAAQTPLSKKRLPPSPSQNRPKKTKKTSAKAQKTALIGAPEAYAQTVIDYYILANDSSKVVSKQKKMAITCFFLPENLDISQNIIHNAWVWDRKTHILSQKNIEIREIVENDSLKKQFVEIIIQKDTISERKNSFSLFFNINFDFKIDKKTNLLVRKNKSNNCTTQTKMRPDGTSVTEIEIECLNRDAQFDYNPKTKIWEYQPVFVRAEERKKWFIRRFLR